MRIIAGAARGRRLAVPPAGTRPTSDRVRESLFSSLDSALAADGVPWSALRVLDLYAGSGALGLEALSRGAAAVLLVESDRRAGAVAADNVRAVGLPGAEVLVRDVRRLAAAPPSGPPFGLVLADPPYDLPAAGVADALAALAAAGWIADGAIVVVERYAREDDSPLPGGWDAGRTRDFGDTRLWYGRGTVEPAPAAEGDGA